MRHGEKQPGKTLRLQIRTLSHGPVSFTEHYVKTLRLQSINNLQVGGLISTLIPFTPLGKPPKEHTHRLELELSSTKGHNNNPTSVQ